MKVLQLGRFYPPSMGGIQRAVYNIREGLAAREVECDVLCCSEGGASTREKVTRGTVYRAANFGNVLSTSVSPQMLFRLKKIAGDYDIIHLHHPDPTATLALFIVRPRVRVVVHWHSDIVRQRIALRFFLPLQEWLLKRADAVIVSTPPYANSRFLQAQRDKVHVVPHGIDPQALRADTDGARAVRVRYADAFIVFALGRLVYYKGFEYLVEAARHLNAKIKIVIGGDGPCLAQLQKLIGESGLAKKVFLPGKLSDREIADHYQACDVFCLSSVLPSEAFGIVQIEAMRFARPVVATTVAGSGIAWVNADRVSGINVRPCDPEALAHAIQLLSDHPGLCRRYGEAGYRRFHDLFTRDKMCAKLHQLYREL